MGGGGAVDPGDRGLAPTVGNASPLIAPAQIGRLDLRHGPFGVIAVPAAVVRETPRVATPGWIVERSLAAPARVVAAGLGPGETAAIALALHRAAGRVILDERRATRLARSLGLPVVGTLGVHVLAKASGHIPAVGPVIGALLDTGFHLAAWVVDDALDLAGEGR